MIKDNAVSLCRECSRSPDKLKLWDIPDKLKLWAIPSTLPELWLHSTASQHRSPSHGPSRHAPMVAVVAAPHGALEPPAQDSSAGHSLIPGAVSATHTRAEHRESVTGPSWGGGQRRLGSCTHRDCAHAQSCLLFRGMSVTQLKHVVRRHYLLRRKRGAGRGELAARRFAHHYVPRTALKSESRAAPIPSADPEPGRRRWQQSPGEVVWHPRVSSCPGSSSCEHLPEPSPHGLTPQRGGF